MISTGKEFAPPALIGCRWGEVEVRVCAVDYALVPAPGVTGSIVVRGLATGMAKFRTRMTGTVQRLVVERVFFTGRYGRVAPAWLGARGGSG